MLRPGRHLSGFGVWVKYLGSQICVNIYCLWSYRLLSIQGHINTACSTQYRWLQVAISYTVYFSCPWNSWSWHSSTHVCRTAAAEKTLASWSAETLQRSHPAQLS